MSNLFVQAFVNKIFYGAEKNILTYGIGCLILFPFLPCLKLEFHPVPVHTYTKSVTTFLDFQGLKTFHLRCIASVKARFVYVLRPQLMFIIRTPPIPI